jgi:hypothetical protein
MSALGQGEKNAANQRDAVMLVMTSEQIAEAQKLSRERPPTWLDWLPNFPYDPADKR